jgi:gamma-glutamyltranspeptidase/glutathione hydrolase
VEYRGYTLHELPPAGQGIAALQMLKMLEAVDYSSMVHNSSEYLHTLIEAKAQASRWRRDIPTGSVPTSVPPTPSSRRL